MVRIALPGLLLLGALCTAAAPAPVAAADEPPYLHLHLSRIRALRDRVAREVVVIEARRRARSWPHHMLRYDGAGIHVGDGRILTCAFYLEGATEIGVRFPDGRRVLGRVLKTSRPLGLALVKVPGAETLPSPPIAPARKQRAGQYVYLLRNPTTPNVQLDLGQLLEPGSAGFYGRASFVARNGHPIFDEWGRVAGVAALPAKEALLAMVIPAWAVRRFLAPASPDGGTGPVVETIEIGP